MDSKYDCMGVNNPKVNGSKRKQLIDSVKVKKTKLKTENASSATKHARKGEENGCNNAPGNKNMVNKDSPQDLLEFRRQLPVYMVRKRFVYFIHINLFKHLFINCEVVSLIPT